MTIDNGSPGWSSSSPLAIYDLVERFFLFHFGKILSVSFRKSSPDLCALWALLLEGASIQWFEEHVSNHRQYVVWPRSYSCMCFTVFWSNFRQQKNWKANEAWISMLLCFKENSKTATTGLSFCPCQLYGLVFFLYKHELSGKETPY